MFLDTKYLYKLPLPSLTKALRNALWKQVFRWSYDKCVKVTICSTNFSKNNLLLQLWPPRSFWRSKRSINVLKTRNSYFWSSYDKCVKVTICSTNFSNKNLYLQLWPLRSFWRSKRSIIDIHCYLIFPIISTLNSEGMQMEKEGSFHCKSEGPQTGRRGRNIKNVKYEGPYKFERTRCYF